MGVHDQAFIMKTVYTKATVNIPEGVKVSIKSRVVSVEGPRGKLSKSFKHVAVDLFKLSDRVIKVEKWNCSSKEQAVIKTVCSHITNLCLGVTKGFKNKMKLVFAHFPVNVQIANDQKSLDIVNFIGQKVKFHVDCHDGCTVERDAKSNTEIIISGNDIENVGLTCSRISQSCAVRNKDIRKFLDGTYVMSKGHVVEDEE